jgi:hypothetical protein
VTGERELVRRREDAQVAPRCVVYEHGLGETEVRRDPLSVALGHLVASEEHTEGIAAGALFGDEDLEDVEVGHRRSPIKATRERPRYLIPDS